VPLTSLFTAFKGKEFTGPYMEHKAGGEFLAKNARITVLKVRFLPAPPPERDDGAKILAESEDVGARLKRFKVVVKYASLYDAYFTDKDFKLEKEGA
jgi:hypothetical protein